MLEQAQTLLSLLHRFYQLGLFNSFSVSEGSTSTGSAQALVSGVVVPALIVLLALIVCVGERGIYRID